MRPSHFERGSVATAVPGDERSIISSSTGTSVARPQGPRPSAASRSRDRGRANSSAMGAEVMSAPTAQHSSGNEFKPQGVSFGVTWPPKVEGEGETPQGDTQKEHAAAGSGVDQNNLGQASGNAAVGSAEASGDEGYSDEGYEEDDTEGSPSKQVHIPPWAQVDRPASVRVERRGQGVSAKDSKPAVGGMGDADGDSNGNGTEELEQPRPRGPPASLKQRSSFEFDAESGLVLAWVTDKAEGQNNGGGSDGKKQPQGRSPARPSDRKQRTQSGAATTRIAASKQQNTSAPAGRSASNGRPKGVPSLQLNKVRSPSKGVRDGATQRSRSAKSKQSTRRTARKQASAMLTLEHAPVELASVYRQDLVGQMQQAETRAAYSSRPQTSRSATSTKRTARVTDKGSAQMQKEANSTVARGSTIASPSLTSRSQTTGSGQTNASSGAATGGGGPGAGFAPLAYLSSTRQFDWRMARSEANAVKQAHIRSASHQRSPRQGNGAAKDKADGGSNQGNSQGSADFDWGMEVEYSGLSIVTKLSQCSCSGESDIPIVCDLLHAPQSVRTQCLAAGNVAALRLDSARKGLLAAIHKIMEREALLKHIHARMDAQMPVSNDAAVKLGRMTHLASETIKEALRSMWWSKKLIWHGWDYEVKMRTDIKSLTSSSGGPTSPTRTVKQTGKGASASRPCTTDAAQVSTLGDDRVSPSTAPASTSPFAEGSADKDRRRAAGSSSLMVGEDEFFGNVDPRDPYAQDFDVVSDSDAEDEVEDDVPEE